MNQFPRSNTNIESPAVMNAPTHPVWKLLLLALILTAVGFYMHMAYANGLDPIKDGGLIVFLGAMATLWDHFSGQPTTGEK